MRRLTVENPNFLMPEGLFNEVNTKNPPPQIETSGASEPRNVSVSEKLLPTDRSWDMDSISCWLLNIKCEPIIPLSVSSVTDCQHQTAAFQRHCRDSLTLDPARAAAALGNLGHNLCPVTELLSELKKHK